ncbi:MAG: alpha/beta fold hydrolase [Pseudomonadota bacterium]|nr:alpha/beta fold hydrolase [Pseudomonadota bacterium]
MLAVVLLAVLSGCVSVSIKARPAASAKHGLSIVTSHNASADTAASLTSIGHVSEQCLRDPDVCATAFGEVEDVLGRDAIHAALSELYLGNALQLKCKANDAACHELRLSRLTRGARHAYLYLFFGESAPAQRAFERRQGQVRQFYNAAVRELVSQLYAHRRHDPSIHDLHLDDGQRLQWQYANLDQMKLPDELIDASSLEFSGLRHSYRRDGFGAEFVAVFAQPVAGDDDPPYRQLDYRPVSVVLWFSGDNADEIARGSEAMFEVFDARRASQTTLAGREVPLAANFSAAYGLWLSRSPLTRAGLAGLLGRAGQNEQAPQIFMLDPYDPSRRVLVLVHGLASNQQAWIDLANDVMGDRELRQNYQIWVVVYPTRMPLLVSRLQIDTALNATFAAFDPLQQARASHDAVLIGHSMGGILARLLVSEPDPDLLDRLLPAAWADNAEIKRQLENNSELQQLVHWSPMPQVARAVFIAAPHRGTDVARGRAVGLLNALVWLPATTLARAGQIVQEIGLDPADRTVAELTRPRSGLQELADDSTVILATRDLRPRPGLPFHSIIARNKPDGALEKSSDGLVPYTSAHLQDADSEIVIGSGHSVQESPQAIIELRRILRLHVARPAP